MTEEEPPPVLSLPSTSRCPPPSPKPSESCSTPPSSPTNFSNLLTLNFDRLSLEPELREGRYEKRETVSRHTKSSENEENDEKMTAIVKKANFYRTPAHRNGRFIPYGMPFKFRRRRKRAASISTVPANFDVLLKIKLKGEVDPLKMCIFDKEKTLMAAAKPCSVQAALPPPAPGANEEELDELSEYFAHFVRVDLKMSSLAESMYV